MRYRLFGLTLLQRGIERELLPMAEAFGLTVAAWAPLAHGKLGKPAGPDADDRERAVPAAVQDVATELSATPSQVALAWTRAHSRAVHPLVGASSPEQLADTLDRARGAGGRRTTTRGGDRFRARFPAEFQHARPARPGQD